MNVKIQIQVGDIYWEAEFRMQIIPDLRLRLDNI